MDDTKMGQKIYKIGLEIIAVQESKDMLKDAGKDWRNWWVQFSSIAQLYSTLCHPMDCSTQGFPVHH